MAKSRRRRRINWAAFGAVTLVVAGLAVFALTRDPGGAAEARTQARPMAMVFMGDSITAGDSPGFDKRPGSLSWARYVTEAEGSPWSFRAIPAVGGQATPALRARFDKDVISRKPAGVAILAGANDVLKIPLQDSLDNLGAMIAKAKKANAKVFLLTLPPNDNHPDKIQPFNAELKALAKSQDVTLLDIYPDLAASNGHWKPGLSPDGIHVTTQGATVIADQVLKQLSAKQGLI